MGLKIWTLKDLIKVLEGRINNKFSVELFIEGKRGLGKSTLAYKILSRMNIPMKFRPRRDIVYTRELVLKHLATKVKGSIFADEMINVSYNRDFYQEDQKTLLKALNMYRDSCNVFIGCIPKFVDLDIQLQRLCNIRITVVRRGVALIHRQRPSIYLTDVWDIKNNQKIESEWTLKGTRNPKYSKLTTVVGILYYGDLTKSQREEYESIKQEKRNKVFGDYNDDAMFADPEKEFYVNLMDVMTKGKLTPEAFEVSCKLFNRKPETVRNRLNKMLKATDSNKRTKDYIISDSKKERRDALGFSKAKEEPKKEKP